MRIQSTLLLIVIPFILFSQVKDEVDQNNQLHLNFGVEYRITPVYKSNVNRLSDAAFYTNTDMQNSGLSLNIGIEYNILKNLSVELLGSLRRDLLIINPSRNINDFSQSDTEKRIMFGYHLKLYYYFKVFRKGEVYIGVGISLLNRNSEYSTEEIFFDSAGNVDRIEPRNGNFKYSAYRFFTGYRFNRSRISIGIYSATNTPYFNDSVNLIIPHLTYTYNFLKLM